MNVRPTIQWVRARNGNITLQEEINGHWVHVPTVEDKEELSPRDAVLDHIDKAMAIVSDASIEFRALEAARMFIEVLKAWPDR